MTSTATAARIPDAARDLQGSASEETKTRTPCFHCGAPCPRPDLGHGDKRFCCRGCLVVFELIAENGLNQFYSLEPSAGVKVQHPAGESDFNYLDEPATREKLVDYTDDEKTRVTFHLPAIHCIACVWLLENLFKFKPGIEHSQVNFPRKEVAITFETSKTRLSEVASLLATLGYEPDLKFADAERKLPHRNSRKLWLQIGIAGFAFGNTMLFGIANYLGLDAFSGPAFKKLTGPFGLILALPVVIYSASDYWKSAWLSLRQRLLNIDVPIAAGLAALFAQSCYEVATGRGEGYFDSLCGLMFFLLCGKLFQRKTFDRLSFDRDYKSFFPLSVARIKIRSEATQFADAANAPKTISRRPGAANVERISLTELCVGDHLLIRNGELIPADARVVEGPSLIDYSFVTGESAPAAKKSGDPIFAGGRQIGGAIEIETTKDVSQSYLASLWDQEVFRKNSRESFNALTNRYSQRFTKIVVGIAVGAGVFWAGVNRELSLKAFTSVLIVACPCALALAAPFALGTAQRVLARQNVFLKNTDVIEALARVDAIVFDKTGTLTSRDSGAVGFRGPVLSEVERRSIYSMTLQSTHPRAVQIRDSLSQELTSEPVASFLEITGSGMEGTAAGRKILMGSAAWLAARGVGIPNEYLTDDRTDSPGFSSPESKTIENKKVRSPEGSHVHLAIDGAYRGRFELANVLRPEVENLIPKLSKDFDLALLSGDNARERASFYQLFRASPHLHFNQSPLNKLAFVRELQRAGKTVMMVGDGLNDAGALKQSDVGVAVLENMSAFSPASDVIMAVGMISQLDALLRFSKNAASVVRASFLISSIYNVIGVTIAARGLLSPVVCAILMPLSSITVVAFACGMTAWLGRRALRASPIRKADAEGQTIIATEQEIFA